MFSLKFDFLFPSFEAARAAARALNAALAVPRPPSDPRRHQQLLDELRVQRERAVLQSTRHRLHVR